MDWEKIANFGAQNQPSSILDTKNETTSSGNGSFFRSHPILSNILVILAVAVLGICIVYFSVAVFTKHGESRVVPKVENMGYTQAVELLHSKGFKVDIRDSIYRDDVKPGYVIEQFPKADAYVKPGRKIFLYINAVHPKEVIIDDDNHPAEDALKGMSFRQGMARLEELGFKNIRIVKVLGDNDRIVKVTANGRTVKKTQRVAINSKMVVEVCDGRLAELRDSLRNVEYMQYASEEYYPEDYYNEETGVSGVAEPDPVPEVEESGEEEVEFIE